MENPMSRTTARNKGRTDGEDDAAATGGTIRAPMPGKISEIAIEVGSEVAKGEVLIVMEAMKMEHKLVAPMSGVVTELTTHQVNDIVPDGMILVRIAAQEEADQDDSTSTAKPEAVEEAL